MKNTKRNLVEKEIGKKCYKNGYIIGNKYSKNIFEPAHQTHLLNQNVFYIVQGREGRYNNGSNSDL